MLDFLLLISSLLKSRVAVIITQAIAKGIRMENPTIPKIPAAITPKKNVGMNGNHKIKMAVTSLLVVKAYYAN